MKLNINFKLEKKKNVQLFNKLKIYWLYDEFLRFLFFFFCYEMFLIKWNIIYQIKKKIYFLLLKQISKTGINKKQCS
jgi:hypothetical protein